MDFRNIVDFIRRFFNPTLPVERNRKRRAADPIDSLMSTKFRKLQSNVSRDLYDFDRENYFLSPKPLRRSSVYKTPPSRNMETVVLDDDDDDGIIEFKKLNGNTLRNNFKVNKFTSTPHNNIHKSSLNGTDDEEVSFVKEVKSLSTKKAEASKKGLNYIKPFSGSIFRPRIVQNGRQRREKSNLIQSALNSASRTNCSFRLDDKMQYKKLLEQSNESSVYYTPKGKLFNYDTANRASRIMAAALRSPTGSSKGRMSTKDTIKKVLDDFEGEPVVIKDSDSDSDVMIVNPPSPKPDIKVDPVNSFKTVVDTAEQTKPEWLEELVNRHKKLIAERQKEIDHLKDCSEKHGKINKDMRMEVLTDKVNKSLRIRDAVLPVVEQKEEAELPPLTDAQLKMVNRAFKGDPNEVLNRKFNLSVTRRDLCTLAGLNWLNDEVINFYMNMIIARGEDSNWPKAYAFNTFFYPKLIKDGQQSLRRWTKKVDIFKHDIICVPIHLGMHWCMAIIDLRDRSIRYYDSMGSSNNKCLDALRRYLEAEHADKKKSHYDTSDFELENVRDIPQQMNGSDCGMFSCTFAEFITRDAQITFNQEHMPYLRKKMVVEILTGELLIK